MAVVIRMKRIGRRNRPAYRIAVADSRKPTDGRVLDNLGIYDPVSSVPELRLRLDVERARRWIENGALPSETVHSIFRRLKVYEGLPVREKRPREGREIETKTRARKRALEAERAAAKEKRRNEKLAAKRAAKRQAAEAPAEG